MPLLNKLIINLISKLIYFVILIYFLKTQDFLIIVQSLPTNERMDSKMPKFHLISFIKIE